MSATGNNYPLGLQITDALIREFGRTESEINYALERRQMTDTERQLILFRQRQLNAAWEAFQAAGVIDQP